MRFFYGVLASFGALNADAFMSMHPGAWIHGQHLTDMLGMNLCLLFIGFCIWQYESNGQGVSNWLKRRKEKLETQSPNVSP